MLDIILYFYVVYVLFPVGINIYSLLLFFSTCTTKHWIVRHKNVQHCHFDSNLLNEPVHLSLWPLIKYHFALHAECTRSKYIFELKPNRKKNSRALCVMISLQKIDYTVFRHICLIWIEIVQFNHVNGERFDSEHSLYLCTVKIL